MPIKDDPFLRNAVISAMVEDDALVKNVYRINHYASDGKDPNPAEHARAKRDLFEAIKARVYLIEVIEAVIEK